MAEPLKRLTQFIGEVTAVSPAALHATGQFAIALIASRTKRGLDADRRAFTVYTPEYAAVREAHQLSRRPDLVRTGHMLGALLPAVGEESVVLSFGGAHDALKAAVNTATRDFFDIRHERDLDAVAEVYADALIGK